MIDWNRRSYTKTEFFDAWHEFDTIHAVRCALRIGKVSPYQRIAFEKASKLGVDPEHSINCVSTKAQRIVMDTAQELGLSANHMLECEQERFNQHVIGTSGRPLKQILVPHNTIDTLEYVYKRVISENVMEPVCSQCGTKDWLGKPAPMFLHRLDGSKDNNELRNLYVLCAMCTYQKD